MIPRTLEEWSIPVIENLLTKGYYETEYFDFKEMLPRPKADDDKRRLRKTCCAFANSDGGFLVFGIKDDKSLPAANRLVGVDPSDDFPAQFGNYPAGCVPTINWDFRNPPIELANKRVVHVVHVPRSWKAPHCIGSREEGWYFTKRTNKGNEGMSYEEVRLLFLGYYEKRLKLQLLMGEVGDINSIANHLVDVAHEDFREKWYSLNSFDLSVVNSVLVDSYTILAEKPDLVILLRSLRMACVVANNNIQVLIRTVRPDALHEQGKLLKRINEDMKDICNGIIDKSTRALELLEEIMNQ